MMKNIFYYISAICIFTLFACDGEIDPVKEFTDGEEIRYPGKVKNAGYLAGENRLALFFQLSPDPNVNRGIVYWNMKQKSLEFDIDRSTQTGDDDVLILPIEDLPENVYNFEIYMFDKFGNRSVGEHLNARTYGKSYRSTLYGRAIKGYEAYSEGNNVVIHWGDSILYSSGVEFHYVNGEGKPVELQINNQEKETILPSVDLNKEVKVLTCFYPEPHAVDRFDVEEKYKLRTSYEVPKPYYKAYVEGFDPNWKASSWWTEIQEWRILWDNTWGKTFDQGGTPWADEAAWGSLTVEDSNFTESTWFTVNIGRKVKLSRYRSGFYWAYQSFCPKRSEIWAYTGEGEPTAEEGWDNWVNLGVMDNSNYTKEEMKTNYGLGDNLYLLPEDAPPAQYYRFRCREAWDGTPFISLAEVTFWAYTD